MNTKIVDYMIENVKRVNFFIPECVEHTFASYGASISADLKKVYVSSWRFDIDCNMDNKRLGECIISKNNLFERYLEYNGVNISVIDVNNIQMIINCIENNTIQNLPTIIHLDTFYSDWGQLYLIEHTNHIALAVGLDKFNKQIYLVDPDYSDEVLCVGFDIIEKATKFFIEVKIENINKYSYDELLKLISNRREYYLTMIKNIKEYAKRFREFFNPKDEFDRDNDIECILNSSLIKNIREVIKDRNMFIVFLEQFNDYYIDKIIELMYISIGKWNTIMNLIFKYSRTRWKENFNDIAYNIIMKIADIESNVLELFVEKSNKREAINGLKGTILNKKGLFFIVDISMYCNNKGFVYDARNAADLTNAGEYFEVYKTKKIITYNNIIFNTYFEKELDNIVCMGQEIYIDLNKNISTLHFLVCAEWGACEDGIIIEYEDGSEEMNKIIAYDISNVVSEGTIEIGCTKDLKGNVINHRAGITYNRIVIPREKQVRSIMLPEAPNLHIISIVIASQ